MRFKGLHRRTEVRFDTEVLEQRVLLATIDWMGGAAGNWDEPANWSGGQLPSINDDVRIVGGSVRPVVTLGTGTHAIRSILAQHATLNITGGSLALTDGGTIEAGAAIELHTGVLATGSTLTVSGPGATLLWSGGTLGGAGSLVIDSSAALNISGPTDKLLSVNLRNDGVATWDGGPLAVVNVTLTNNGAFQAMPGTISGGGAAVTLANGGTFRQSRSGAIDFQHAGFVNTGVIDATANIRMTQFSGFEMAGGSVAGDVAVYDYGVLHWTAGEMIGPGRTLVSDDARAYIDGTAPKTLRRTLTAGGRDVTITGELTFNDGQIVYTDVGHRLILRQCALLDGGGTNRVTMTGGDLELDGTVVIHVPIDVNSVDPPSASSVLHLLGGGRFRSGTLYLGEVRIGGPGFEFEAGVPRGRLYFEEGASTIGGDSVLQSLHVRGGAAARFEAVLNVTGLALVTGSGSTLEFAGTSMLSTLDVSVAGRVRMIAGGAGVLRSGALTLDSGSILDLGGGSAIIDYTPGPLPSPFTQVEARVRSGYHDGAWDGAGIHCSVAAAQTGYAVGCAEAGEVFDALPATFAGQEVDETTVLLTSTVYGDANLDRAVDLADFNRLTPNFGGWSGWSGGDFTFDRRVNLRDFNRLALNFGRSSVNWDDASTWHEDPPTET